MSCFLLKYFKFFILTVLNLISISSLCYLEIYSQNNEVELQILAFNRELSDELRELKEIERLFLVEYIVRPTEVLEDARRKEPLSDADIEKIKEAIFKLQHPLLISLPVWKELKDKETFASKDYQWSTMDIKGKNIGWHPFLLIGFDDTKEIKRKVGFKKKVEKGVFLVFNHCCCFGTNWGKKGVFEVSYEFMKKYLLVCYYILTPFHKQEEQK